jgi:1-deoxy-D-xylulose-5-phosphate synthase
MAVAARRTNGSRRAVAIIGDGAMSAGMAFEALNNAGAADADLLVVLNDNDMSISEPVGALNNYLARLLSGRIYNYVRRGSKEMLTRLPQLREFARRWESHMKGMVTPGTLFEELGFNYIGPIDGHDLAVLVPTLANLKQLKGPQLLHVITRKGNGYAPAEADPILYHGVPSFDPVAGIVKKPPGKPTYTQIFGDWICDMAASDARLVCITPAMREGSGLVRFAREYPDRYFDVGIAEQHAVTFAAGLACDGMKPVVAIYSTFLQRGYDQLIHDVALQNLPVLFAIDRAGIVGADGATHMGAFDLCYLRCLPNMIIMAPADENECRQMLYTGFTLNGPVAVRYPRGTGPGVAVAAAMSALPLGRAQTRRRSSRARSAVAILAFGSVLGEALLAAEALDATVVNMRYVKPLDVDLLLKLAPEHAGLVTVEENAVSGGAGSAVAEALANAAVVIPMLHLGMPDRFIDHGDPAALIRECGLDADGIVSAIQSRFPRRLLDDVSKSVA